MPFRINWRSFPVLLSRYATYCALAGVDPSDRKVMLAIRSHRQPECKRPKYKRPSASNVALFQFSEQSILSHDPHLMASLRVICGRKAAAAGLPPIDSYDLWPLLSGKTTVSPRTELAVGDVSQVGGLITADGTANLVQLYMSRRFLPVPLIGEAPQPPEFRRSTHRSTKI